MISCSQLGIFWENIWSKFHCLTHISLDLHLASHESILWIQFTLRELNEIVINLQQKGETEKVKNFAKQAKAIAEEFFDSKKVLNQMLEKVS